MQQKRARIVPLFCSVRLHTLHCNKADCVQPVTIIGIPDEPIEPLICWCGVDHARQDGWPFFASERRGRRGRVLS